MRFWIAWSIGVLAGCAPRIEVIETGAHETEVRPAEPGGTTGEPTPPSDGSATMGATTGAHGDEGRPGGSDGSESASSSTGLPDGCFSPSCTRCSYPEAFPCLPRYNCSPGTLPTIDWARVGTDDCWAGDCLPVEACGVGTDCDCDPSELCLSVRDYTDESCDLIGWQCVPELDDEPGCSPCATDSCSTVGRGPLLPRRRDCSCMP